MDRAVPFTVSALSFLGTSHLQACSFWPASPPEPAPSPGQPLFSLVPVRDDLRLHVKSFIQRRVPGLLHLEECPPGSSTLSQVAGFSSSRPNTLPQYIQHTRPRMPPDVCAHAYVFYVYTLYVHTRHIFFTPSSITAHLGCFPVSAVVNNAAVDAGEPGSLQDPVEGRLVAPSVKHLPSA